MARTARAALGAGTGPSRPAVAPIAPTATAATAATASNASELLDGLAGDVRVGGEAQTDAAALAVDLDHAHFHLVALVEDILDGLNALAGRDV
jgi:hypothetical protein